MRILFELIQGLRISPTLANTLFVGVNKEVAFVNACRQTNSS